MSSLRNKAISGASWSLVGKLLQQGSRFIFGIILARLLLPEQYGLVAMAMVFIAVFEVFVNAGFGAAIVQRKQIENIDLSTVFYLNLGVSLFSYIILYFLAVPIANFYNEPQLVNIIRILSILVILFALTIVQNSLITREVNFKLRTRIELVAQILSASVAIVLALKGWGVWAIVWKTLLTQVIINIQLWLNNHWFPALEFSKTSFRSLFSFSSKLLISSLIDKIYQQMYRLIVGKFFPAAELGYYSRAEQFKELPNQTFAGSLLSFLLPVFSKLQDEPERLKSAAKRIIKIAMFLNLNTLIILGVFAKQIIYVLLGDSWMKTVPYLQLLVLTTVLYPMHVINVRILTALGRSDLFLKIEIYKKLLGVIPVLLAIFLGIKEMIIGMIFTSVIALIINTYYTSQFIHFGFVEQLKSVSKSFLIAVIILVTFVPIVFFFRESNSLIVLIVGFLTSVLSVYFLSRMFKMEEYYELKRIAIDFRNKYVGKR
jgi:teichuronic acid exporter